MIAAIKQVIEVEKGKILFTKPLNAILVAGDAKKEEITKDLHESESLVQNLNTPDEELEDRLKDIVRTERKLSRKVGYLADDLDSVFRAIVSKGCREMESEVDRTCRAMTRIVNEWGIYSKVDNILPQLESELQKLVTRTLKYEMDDLSNEARDGIKKRVGDFLADMDPIISKMQDSRDVQEFQNHLDKELKIVIDDDLFKMDNSEDEEVNYGWGNVAWDCIYGFLNGYTFGAVGLVKKVVEIGCRVAKHDETKNDLMRSINTISRDFNPKELMESLYQNKDAIVDCINKVFFEEYIHPMQKQIEKILANRGDKEKQLQEAKDKCQLLIAKKKDGI